MENEATSTALIPAPCSALRHFTILSKKTVGTQIAGKQPCRHRVTPRLHSFGMQGRMHLEFLGTEPGAASTIVIIAHRLALDGPKPFSVESFGSV